VCGTGRVHSGRRLGAEIQVDQVAAGVVEGGQKSSNGNVLSLFAREFLFVDNYLPIVPIDSVSK
jgi:hypothetical protein